MWGGKAGREANDARSTWLPRNLAFVLRHAAQGCGLQIDPHGWVSVDSLLKLQDVRVEGRLVSMQGFSLEDVKEVVKNCPKRRFEIKHTDEESGERWIIRATQGHSIQEVSDDMHQKVTSLDDVDGEPEVLHGTTLAAWLSIRKEGLRIMGRKHIHMCLKPPGDKSEISGMRSGSEVIVHIRLQQVLEEGIEVVRSANGVVLTAGQDGVLSSRFFGDVYWQGPPKVVLFAWGMDLIQEAQAYCEDDSDFALALQAATGKDGTGWRTPRSSSGRDGDRGLPRTRFFRPKTSGHWMSRASGLQRRPLGGPRQIRSWNAGEDDAFHGRECERRRPAPDAKAVGGPCKKRRSDGPGDEEAPASDEQGDASEEGEWEGGDAPRSEDWDEDWDEWDRGEDDEWGGHRGLQENRDEEGEWKGR